MLSLSTTICTHLAAAMLGAVLASSGTWKVMDLRAEAKAATQLRAQKVADAAARSDSRQQQKFNDIAAGKHAADLANLNSQLGAANAHIAQLSSRRCLSAGTVRVLNGIGAPAPGLGVRAPANKPAGPPETTPGHQSDDGPNYASERDTAEAIAVCRASYATVASQLNQILDIEDARQERRLQLPLTAPE